MAVDQGAPAVVPLTGQSASGLSSLALLQCTLKKKKRKKKNRSTLFQDCDSGYGLYYRLFGGFRDLDF